MPAPPPQGQHKNRIHGERAAEWAQHMRSDETVMTAEANAKNASAGIQFVRLELMKPQYFKLRQKMIAGGLAPIGWRQYCAHASTAQYTDATADNCCCRICRDSGWYVT
jgi:hypothetical protein